MSVSEGIVYDLIIVGAGVGGLQTAISAAFEGINTLVVEQQTEAGGQAGSSSRIENLIGFPKGISGRQLTSAAVTQATRFRTSFHLPFRAEKVIHEQDGTFCLVGEDRSRFRCKSIVLATGVQYKSLDAKHLDSFVGRGVSYGHPATDPGKWKNAVAGIVGGANSAGQSAMFLAGCTGCKVEMFVRGAELVGGMSSTLTKRIQSLPNITVHTNTAVKEVLGNSKTITGVVIETNGVIQRLKLNHLSVLIGATPHTTWLDDVVELDDRGFVLTDRNISDGKWPLAAQRAPYAFETSVPGIFAIGDVQQGLIKRVGASIGHGSMVAASVYQFLLHQNGHH